MRGEAARESLASALTVAEGLPAGQAAGLVRAAQSAFLDGMHLASYVTAGMLAAVALLALVGLRGVPKVIPEEMPAAARSRPPAQGRAARSPAGRPPAQGVGLVGQGRVVVGARPSSRVPIILATPSMVSMPVPSPGCRSVCTDSSRSRPGPATRP